MLSWAPAFEQLVVVRHWTGEFYVTVGSLFQQLVVVRRWTSEFIVIVGSFV